MWPAYRILFGERDGGLRFRYGFAPSRGGEGEGSRARKNQQPDQRRLIPNQSAQLARLLVNLLMVKGLSDRYRWRAAHK